MVYRGELPGPGGSRAETRLSFLRQGPDQVRQLSESTTDGGKTWTVNYDFIYTRKPKTPTAAAP